MLATISSGSTTSMIVRSGDQIVEMHSTDPWYRLFRALADLFIAGEIDTEELSDGIRHDHPDQYTCPAARHVLSSIYLALDEPACEHGGNQIGVIICNCPPADRRARLRELIGA